MRRTLFIAWLLFFAATLYDYFFHADFLHNRLADILLISPYAGYFFLLLIGSLRGFTFIPVTSLIIMGLLFFPPLPLYVAIMAGIAISSASVYVFSRSLRIAEFFGRRHHRRIVALRATLQRTGLPIIVLWSAAPFLPTDLICYVAGTLRINFTKFLLGVILGEAFTCGLYIFLGNYLLHYAHIL